MSWSGGLVEWQEDSYAYISVVFSWQLEQAYQRCVWHKSMGKQVIIGGPAILNKPEMFNGVAIVDEICDEAKVHRHNPNATFTSRGCIRKCPFCIVPKTEGKFVEIKEWPVRPIVCDNNFLASSDKHFNDAIDKLTHIKNVDFNQGLDARLLTKDRADRLRELHTRCIRLAWDDTRLENQFMGAVDILQRAGFSSWHIRVYVLIGYNDTPEDARYRLEKVKSLKMWPNPMRYQPIDAIRKNVHIGQNWSEMELRNYMRYWSRQNWLYKVPYEEYVNERKHNIYR